MDEEAQKLLMQSFFEECLINPEEEIEYPEPAISCGVKGYETKNGIVEYPIPIGTYGNFSFLQAPPKSKKTFFISLLSATYLANSINGYTSQLKGFRNGKKLIHFDTEQGSWHSAKVFKRPLEMFNLVDKENYHTFALRSLSYKERVGFIEFVLYEHLEADNIGLVIIDGVADLCSDVNNIEESNAVVQKLMKYTKELNCHIITVIHSNFGSDKPTGHLGSFLEKKCETQIQLELNTVNKDLVTVSCKRSRNAPFEQFSFKVNNYGLPEVVGDLYDPLKDF